MKLMQSSYSVEDLNNSFMRAKGQNIWIPLEQFSEQSDKLFNKDLT